MSNDPDPAQATRIRFRLVPSLIVATLAAILCSLGVWQLDRAQQKRDLISAFDSGETDSSWQVMDEPPPRYTRVQFTGHYLADRQVLMDGLSYRGRPGYQVLTPLLLAPDEVVIVNRGWRPFETRRSDVSLPPAPDELVRVTGRAVPFAVPGLRLAGGNPESADSWPVLAVYPGRSDVARWLDREIGSAVILLDPDAPHGFVRDWRPTHFQPSRHLGYALQWFALAIALIALFVIASRERASSRRGSAR